MVRAIERLRLFAQREFDRAWAPAALSSQVYWWHDGRLRLIRSDLVHQDGQTRLVVAPPPEFARVLRPWRSAPTARAPPADGEPGSPARPKSPHRRGRQVSSPSSPG